jgi:hypothetical protein
MPKITAAADESAATTLLHDAETTLGTLTTGPNSGNLGPFSATYSASVSFSGGTVTLTPPDIIGIANCNLNYTVSLHFGVDLNNIIPPLCFPSVCILNFCTPSFCITWQTISVPVNFGDTATFTADFHLNPHLSGPDWLIDVVINGIPQLEFGPATAGILLLIEAAVTPAVAAVPFIGPFIAAAVDAIITFIGIAGLTGFLGQILTPFVSGLTFTIYKQPQSFPALPAAGPLDPEADVTITSLAAIVAASDKNELVITAGIAG